MQCLAPFAFLLALATSALAAQSHTISPAGLAPVFGGNTTGYPWGYGTMPVFRYQQIHDDLAGRPRVLLGLAVRRKEAGAAWPALGPTLQLDLSTAAVGSQSATSTFATNHGTNRTTVMASRVVNFPIANPPTNNLPAPFTYVMQFDNPYLHTGQGGICWEVLMTANPYTGATVLNLDLAQNALARNLTYGTGCGGTTLAGSYAVPNLTLTAAGLVPNGPAFLMIGVDNGSSAGVPLPLDLAFLNAAGCFLFVHPALVLTLVANAVGTATFTANLVAIHPNLVASFQVAAPSASIPMGLAFTNGFFSTPNMPPTCMRNWNSNTSSPTGNLQIVYGLVTDFIQP